MVTPHRPCNDRLSFSLPYLKWAVYKNVIKYTLLQTGCESDFADHDPAQVELEWEANGASDASWDYRNDELACGLAGSVWKVIVDERPRREVDTAHAKVDLCRLEDAHITWEHVVGVDQYCTEVAHLQTTYTLGVGGSIQLIILYYIL